MMDPEAAERLALVEANSARALDEIARMGDHLQQVLEQTGCTLADNIETDKAMRAKFKAEQIRAKLAAERAEARAQAKRELAAGFGMLSGAVTLVIAIGTFVLTYRDEIAEWWRW